MQSFFRHVNYPPARGFKDCEISSLLINCCWGCRDAVLHTVASGLKRLHRMVIDQLRIDWIRFIFSLIIFWTNKKRVGLCNFDLIIIIFVWLLQNHLKGLLIFQTWAISHCPASILPSDVENEKLQLSLTVPITVLHPKPKHVAIATSVNSLYTLSTGSQSETRKNLSLDFKLNDRF